MANYGLKYLCEYRSKMRDKILYRIEICERDALPLDDAKALVIRPCEDVFSIKWGGNDDAEYVSVKGSQLTLKLLCVDDMEYIQLFTIDPRKYRITIYEYRNNIDGEPIELLLWRGFLAANSYKEEFARVPYLVTLSATDGFSFLDGLPFCDSNGLKLTGEKTLMELLERLLEVIDLGLPICDWIGLHPVSPSDISLLKRIAIDCDRIYDMIENPSWRNILDFCTLPFMAQIFQSGGAIHVRRIMSLRNPKRPDIFYANMLELGKKRPAILNMWAGGCSLSSKSELNLMPPYKLAEVSLSYKGSPKNDLRYYSAYWGGMFTNVFILNHKACVTGVRGERVVTATCWLPDKYHPVSSAKIDISAEVFNVSNKDALEDVLFVVEMYIDGSGVYAWDDYKKEWVVRGTLENADEKRIDPSKPPVTSFYSPLGVLSSASFKATVTYIPELPNFTDCWLVLSFSNRSSTYNKDIRFIVSNISVDSDMGDNADMSTYKLPISSVNSDKCSWSVPVRDGGFLTNPSAMLPGVLTFVGLQPITAWMGPTDNGSLLGRITDDVYRLRSKVVRQLDGELCSPFQEDLNSLYFDDKYTNAVYYVNSMKFIAARQVYQVQLRELIDAQHDGVGFLGTVGPAFGKCEELMASLDDVLFLRTGDKELGLIPYGVNLYNTSTENITTLPFTGNEIAIRKGVGAVTLQVEDSDLYAVDNLGNVLSHLDASVSDVIEMSNAQYDAIHKMWVSYRVDIVNGQTEVVVFTKDQELQSQNTFSVVAKNLMLMSNGYVINTEEGTYWHSYEYHSADILRSVTDSSDPMDSEQFETLALSDTLVVKRYLDAKLGIQICGRSGLKFQAPLFYTRFDVENLQACRAVCNNGVVLIFMDVETTQYYIGYDCENAVTYEMGSRIRYGMAVAGRRVYGLFRIIPSPAVLRRLTCVSFDTTCLNQRTNE